MPSCEIKHVLSGIRFVLQSEILYGMLDQLLRFSFRQVANVDHSDIDQVTGPALHLFERVRQAYLDMAAAQPARYRVVDAALPLAGVQQQIEQYLQQLAG